MSFLRPEVTEALRRHSELIAAGGVTLLGLWIASFGGYFLTPLGALIALTGLGIGLIAWRRLRFAAPVAAPGVVQVDEGQIGYFGTDFGGFVAERDLVEVRLLRLNGLPHWRLKQADGQALLIPHAAAGAGALFDVFAVLPGLDLASLTDALADPAPSRVIWQHPARLARS